MGGFWNLCEARLVQERGTSSAINAEVLGMGVVVPQGKCWVILGVSYMPDVAETQTISFQKVTGTGNIFSVLNPVSLALNPARATFIEQGMEYILFPGEYISVRRASHTAGSVMSLATQYVEIDLPLYSYDEPQLQLRQRRAVSSIANKIGGTIGRGSTAPTMKPDIGGRGGGGRGEPI